MGYVYRGGSLVCDGCTSTGAKLRECTYFVTEPNGQRLRYCSPVALCDGCLAKVGGRAGLHAKCKEGAARSQAGSDAKAARLAAGELFVSSALSGRTWYVPAGLTGVQFSGRAGAQTWRLVPHEDYDREYRAKGLMLALSDFPGALPWEDNPDVRKAREAGQIHAYTVVPLSAPHCEQFEPFELFGTDVGKVAREARKQLGHDQCGIVRSDTLGVSA
jgi:hypothetical protein